MSFLGDLVSWGTGGNFATMTGEAVGWDTAGEVFDPVNYQEDRTDRIAGEAAANYPNSAAGMTAALLRAQFEDWQKTFMPIELNAINQISSSNPDILPAAVNKAKTLAENSTGVMSGVLERQNAALGVMPTAQQQNVSKRLMNLDQAAQVAGASNAARENVAANDEAILTGSAPNPLIARQ